MIPAEDGGPVILYDAQDGKLGEFSNVSAPLDKPILGVARLTDPHDQYLMTWTRVAGNPVKFEGAPNAFPGQIWKNGDHWNMMMQGDRYQSDDASFHSWSNKGPMVGKGEHGGQWWIRVPNQQDGSPPPAGVPNYIVNVGGGDSYMFGEYYPENETFVPWVKPGEKTPVMAQLEGAHGGWWGAQTANERMLMIGWALGDYHGPAGPGIDFLTRLTLLREVHFDAKTMNLVSNPVPELAAARTGTLAQEKGLQLAPGSVHMVGNTSAGAAASADVTVTFKLSSASGTVGVCVLSNGTSGGLGISVTAAQGNLKVTAGACADALVNRHTADSDAANNTIPLFDETEVSVRVLPDRSLADFFVQGGRWSGTVAWLEKSPRLAVDSGVQVWSSTAGVTADVEVFSMGCGWANPSYTDNPTM